MTTTMDLDRLIESVLRERGADDAPPASADRAIAAAARLSQTPVRVAALDGRTWPTRAAPTSGRPGLAIPGSRWARVVAAALLGLLVLALIAAGAMIGSRRPTPSLFAAIVPSPSSLATPRATLAPLAGPTLVYGRQTGGLFIADADGSSARTVLADGGYIHPRLSLDRRWIATGAYGTLGRDFVVLRRDGSVALKIPSVNPIVDFAWGAAGHSAAWLAVAIDDAIVVVDPSSGSRLSIDTGGDTYIQGLAWSPDAPVLWWAAVRPGSGDRYHGFTAADVHSVRLDETDGTLRIADRKTIGLALDPARRARELEEIAVSPDGRRLALRARIEGWLRSDLLIVDADGGPVTYLTAAPPGAPWLTAWSGIRWLPDGSGVVAEVGDVIGGAPVRPTVIPVDGSPPRSIDVGRLTVDGGGIVESSGPVLPTDTAVLVGGERSWLDVPGGGSDVSVHDLWIANADGSGSHLVATDTLGGDLR